MKGHIILIYSFTIIFLKCVAKNLQNPKLESIQVLFRHGERTPSWKENELLRPEDQIFFEPYGIEQLTNVGKSQAYHIGLKLRELYNDFLGEAYKPIILQAYSSDTERTKESLQLVLAALFPPNDALRWNKDLNWIPIATKAYPREMDIFFWSTECPDYRKALREFIASPESKELFKEYNDLFTHFESKLRTRLESVNHYDLNFLYNIATAMKIFKFPTPDWYSDEIINRLEKFNLIFYKLMSYTPELKRRNGGILVNKFLDNMKKNDTNNRVKLYLYSGHDYNIYAVSEALGFNIPSKDKFVHFGSALILETYISDSREKYFKILYYDGVDESLQNIRLKNCDLDICTMDKIIELSKDVMPTEDELRCLIKHLDQEKLQKIVSYD